MAKLFSKYLGKFVLMVAAAMFVACGDDSSGSGPENTESSAVEESSSSADIFSSSSSWIATNSSSSRSDKTSSSSVLDSREDVEIMPSGTYDCSKYKCITTEFLNQDFQKICLFLVSIKIFAVDLSVVSVLS